jgi:crotonobetainyl-CoA:carnitine CoA-transferase CaiB-like acyl-CoA transferase
MPNRVSAWGIYDVFTVRDGEQIFLAVVSDSQWGVFCDAFGFADLGSDVRLATNNGRVHACDWMMPLLRERLAQTTALELGAAFEQHGLPYVPIARPQDLFDDPHLSETGGLAPMTIPASASGAGHDFEALAPLLPLSMDGERHPLRRGPPAIGADGVAIPRGLGSRDGEIKALQDAGVLAGVPTGVAATSAVTKE